MPSFLAQHALLPYNVAMQTLTLSIHNAAGALLADASADSASNAWLHLLYNAEYADGDTITLTAPQGTHLVLQLDDALESAHVYCTDTHYRYIIPFGEQRLSYNPKAFTGSIHLLRARFATAAEVAQYRNLAANSHDMAVNDACFPHASATTETRGESVFAARNAIDGNCVNTGHGNWPYESWGINKDPTAALHLDFGRAVTVDKLVLVTRADFPHDSYWTQATVAFSDESTLILPLRKTATPQEFTFTPKTITALTLRELRKAKDDPSPFPALTQLEVYGYEAELT